MNKRPCRHRKLLVKTEPDRCSWVECQSCDRTGPKKHSYMLALICFATDTINGQCRKRRTL